MSRSCRSGRAHFRLSFRALLFFSSIFMEKKKSRNSYTISSVVYSRSIEYRRRARPCVRRAISDRLFAFPTASRNVVYVPSGPDRLEYACLGHVQEINRKIHRAVIYRHRLFVIYTPIVCTPRPSSPSN